MKKLWRTLILFVACGSFMPFDCAIATQAQNEHLVPADKALTPESTRRLFQRGRRETFRGKDLNTIGMPIGGIGTGKLYLRGDGTLGLWQIFNKHVSTDGGQSFYRTYKPDSPVDSGFAMIIEKHGTAIVRQLDQRFGAVEFTGEYPIGLVRYHDDDLPVKVEMEVLSPFIPLNAKDSALPATLFRVTVENTTTEDQHICILAWLQNAVCMHSANKIQALHRSRIVTEKGRAMIVHTAEQMPMPRVSAESQIELSHERPKIALRPIDKLEDYGSMALALTEGAASSQAAQDLLTLVSEVAPNLHAEEDISYPITENRSAVLLTPTVQLPVMAKYTFTFVLAWFFPNHPNGHEYANRFSSVVDVVHYVLDNRERLVDGTRRWYETYYEYSTLPRWLLFRLHSPVCNLATGTYQWHKDGQFWAWEGIGCYTDTCTHVSNYAHAPARLFPELERSAREIQDFGQGFDDESGLVGFRGNRAYSADGQCGTILKAYREHQMSADYNFLKHNWSRIKKALEFSISKDSNEDGLIETSQHNTFGVSFEGPNTFVGSLYLAALRAGEEMAKEMDDEQFAKRCRKIFESGRRLTIEHLWNGEYFIQCVDLDKYPKHQYGNGCLSDQLFGQGWAHQLGLGYLYPPQYVKTALQSVWKYNWAPDVGPYYAEHKPERIFAYPGEPGLLICTWPKSTYLDEGVRYRNEVWTGTEYQVAGHMVWEGMVAEALAICDGIHRRYHPSKHNPFNEVECSEHCARAMASWGVYTALAGYEYHGPKGHLGFAPKITPEDFEAGFTAAEGWATFSQQRTNKTQSEQIEMRWGQLRLKSLTFEVPQDWLSVKFDVKVAGKPFEADHVLRDGRLDITFNNDVILFEGWLLEVTIERQDT